MNRKRIQAATKACDDEGDPCARHYRQTVSALFDSANSFTTKLEDLSRDAPENGHVDCSLIATSSVQP